MSTNAMHSFAAPTGSVGDFDFLPGAWNVSNRRLIKRWVGCSEWDEFPASYRCTRHLAGVVNVDEMIVPSKGFSGMTLRAFDVVQSNWAIYWINSHSGVLCPPVHGGFCADRGDFYGVDTDEGKPIRVHFIWLKLGRDHARWQQSFSHDGHQWETNWIMDFSRSPCSG